MWSANVFYCYYYIIFNCFDFLFHRRFHRLVGVKQIKENNFWFTATLHLGKFVLLQMDIGIEDLQKKKKKEEKVVFWIKAEVVILNRQVFFLTKDELCSFGAGKRERIEKAKGFRQSCEASGNVLFGVCVLLLDAIWICGWINVVNFRLKMQAVILRRVKRSYRSLPTTRTTTPMISLTLRPHLARRNKCLLKWLNSTVQML